MVSLFFFFLNSDSTFEVKYYRYYKPSNRGFDFEGCLEDLNVSINKIKIFFTCNRY